MDKKFYCTLLYEAATINIASSQSTLIREKPEATENRETKKNLVHTSTCKTNTKTVQQYTTRLSLGVT